MRKPVYLVGLLVVALPSASLAQDRDSLGDIYGQVQEAGSDNPVENVTVTLTELQRSTMTDGRGRFVFENVIPGEYNLRLKHLGFRSQEKRVKVRSRIQLNLTIRLRRAPIEVDPLMVSIQSELRVPMLENEGYYRRREVGFGEYLGPRYLTRWSGTRLRGIVQRIPNARLVRARRPSNRYRAEFQSCGTASIYVDGLSWGTKVPRLPTSAIAAVEAYDGSSAGIGTRFFDRCSIRIWTWDGPNPFNHIDLSEAECPLPQVHSEGC